MKIWILLLLAAVALEGTAGVRVLDLVMSDIGTIVSQIQRVGSQLAGFTPNYGNLRQGGVGDEYLGVVDDHEGGCDIDCEKGEGNDDWTEEDDTKQDALQLSEDELEDIERAIRRLKGRVSKVYKSKWPPQLSTKLKEIENMLAKQRRRVKTQLRELQVKWRKLKVKPKKKPTNKP